MNEKTDTWPPGHPKVEAQAAPASVISSSTAVDQPSVAEPAASHSPQQIPTLTNAAIEQILAALSHQIPPVDQTAGYRLGILWTAFLLVMIPAIFTGTFVLSVLGLIYCFQHGIVLGMLLVFAILVVQGFFTLSLLKAYFAPAGDYPPPLVLERQHEPALFAAVERLCGVVGAPMPARIEVDTDVNASASFGHGFIGTLLGRRFVLRIGLPLVAGLPLRQLIGVIAHELGHFTQDSGMRLSFIIRSLNAWFEVAALGRDAWDLRLAQMVGSGGLFGGLARFMQLGVGMTRYGLYFMRNFIHMFICRLMREMEYDADLHEMRTVGSNAFILTSMNMYALSYGSEHAHADLSQSWRDDRLSDDLPAMVVAKVSQLRANPELAAKVKGEIFEEKTEWFMTHPSTPERIEAAKRENAPGIFHVDAPATVLFSDFEGLCKMATLYYYQGVIGPDVTPNNLVATKTIVHEQNELDEALETLSRYFQGKILGSHELFLPKEMLFIPKQPNQTAQLLKQSRQRMIDHLMDTVKASRRYEVADSRVHELHKLQIVLKSGFLFNPAKFRLRDASHYCVQAALTQAEAERNLSRRLFQEALRDSQNRLIAALQLLHVPKVMQKLANPVELQQRCRAMLTALVALESVWPTVTDLMEVGSALEMLLDLVESTEVDHQLYQQVISVNQEAIQRIEWIRGQLTMQVYPFEHARGKISIGDYALSQIPPKDNIGEVLGAAAEMLDKLNNLYYRVIAYLASIAESVETVFGFQPLPKPPEQQGDNWWETDISSAG